MAETVISLRLGEAYWLTIQLVPEYDRSFEYDLVGNAVGGSRGPAEFYSNFLARNGSSTFVADPDGFGETIKEITGDKVKNYVYRADGKISPFRSGNLSVNYFYDGLDRLVAKVMNQGGTVFTNTFTHLIDENRVLLGKAGDGNVSKYIDGQGMAERLGEVKESRGTGYITEHLGSVLNSDVAGVWKNYGLFGEISKVTSVTISSSPVTYGFTGHKVDLESGLNRTKNRMYDAKSAHWTRQDPIGISSRDENYYRYVFNNPLVFTDSTGESASAEILIKLVFPTVLKKKITPSVGKVATCNSRVIATSPACASTRTAASTEALNLGYCGAVGLVAGACTGGSGAAPAFGVCLASSSVFTASTTTINYIESCYPEIMRQCGEY